MNTRFHLNRLIPLNLIRFLRLKYEDLQDFDSNDNKLNEMFFDFRWLEEAASVLQEVVMELEKCLLRETMKTNLI